MIKYYKCNTCFHLVVDGDKMPTECPHCGALEPYREINEIEYERLFKDRLKRIDRSKRNGDKLV